MYLVAKPGSIPSIPEPKARATKTRKAVDLSDLQPVHRDFAFVVDRAVAAAAVVRAAASADKKLIADVAVFDLFESEALGARVKSIAIDVTLQPRERTLTEDDIEAVASKIVSAVERATGGTLRALPTNSEPF